MSKVVNNAAGSKSGIKIVNEPGPEELDRLLAPLPATGESAFTRRVGEIVEAVRRGGDGALVQLQKEIDGVDLAPEEWEVPIAEWEASARAINPSLLNALTLSADRIRMFHEDQREANHLYRMEDGTLLGTRVFPLERVGIYIPGDAAGYPSSVLMNAIPARVAGVGEIVAVTPHPSLSPGKLSPAVLAACSVAGIDRLFRLGGAQAIAALAYGTETVPRVDKIVGRGNRWVAQAKKQLVGTVGIDMVAGPTEVLIIADDSASPDHVAADLLAQAEHDRDACVWLVTTARDLAEKVDAKLAGRLEVSPRRDIASASVVKNGVIVIVPDLDCAVGIANRKAPAHLELVVREPEGVLAGIRNAGAVFVGALTPESIGHYMAGPSHVRPTGGTARFSSSLGVYDFVKRMTVIEYSRDRFDRDRDAVIELAEAEGLPGHAEAIRARTTRETG